MDSYPVTEQTQVKRLPKRGVYDKAQVHAILDEGFLCHVGFTLEPTTLRDSHRLCACRRKIYIHGSAASRMLRTLDQGIKVCVTVTLLDGLVLARSVFDHSMNYRSVVVWARSNRSRTATRRSTRCDALRITLSRSMARGPTAE